MYYKNYWVSYNDFQMRLMCAVSDIDYSEIDKKEINKHFKQFFFIDRIKYENVRGFLDENGLFMGIFPPELIEEDIRNYKKEQDKQNLEALERIKLKYKEPLPESFFKAMALHNEDIPTVYQEVQISNMMSKDYWGIEFPIEEYYMEYLLKYWGFKFVW